MRIEREFGAGDVVMVSRSALLEGVVAELLDYFGDPRGYGSKLRERGVSGDDPEGGARRGVLRRRLVTGRLGRLGTPPSGHYDPGARSSL